MAFEVSEWDEIKGYVEAYPKAEVFYKLDYQDDERSRLRILAGRLCLDQVIKEKEQLEGMLKFLDQNGAKAVVRQRDFESFFL
jgi:hypothetical protein